MGELLSSAKLRLRTYIRPYAPLKSRVAIVASVLQHANGLAARGTLFERGVIPTKGCSECHLLPTDLTVRETAERANINITELMDFKTAAVDAIINHVIKLT